MARGPESNLLASSTVIIQEYRDDATLNFPCKRRMNAPDVSGFGKDMTFALNRSRETFSRGAHLGRIAVGLAQDGQPSGIRRRNPLAYAGRQWKSPPVLHLPEQQCRFSPHGAPTVLQKHCWFVHVPEQHSLAVSVEQGSPPLRQQRFRPERDSGRHCSPFPLQHFRFFPCGLQPWSSLLQRRLRFPASASLRRITPNSEAAKPPAAIPKRRRVQASKCEPSMQSSLGVWVQRRQKRTKRHAVTASASASHLTGLAR